MRTMIAVLVLGACAQAHPIRPMPDPIPYVLDANGIQLTATPQRIDFGRTDHSTIPAMSKLVGQAPTATQECAGGGQKVDWPDGTTLIFTKGEFRGWSIEGRSAGFTC